MQHCIHCGGEIIENSAYCSVCGKPQREIDSDDLLDTINKNTPNKGNKGFLLTLCILTLVGSSIGIVRGLLYQFFALEPHFGNSEYIRGWLFVIVNLGTIIGAIILLSRKKMLGLYIYSLFQVAYLCLIIWTTSVYLDGQLSDNFTLVLSLFFFLPSLAFLIMYWTKPIRNNLS